MAVDLPEVHVAALAATREYVVGIGADQWTGPTPCVEWGVRALVNHIVSGNFWAAELGRGKTIEAVGDRLDGDVLGDDPVAEYLVSAELAGSTFRAPGRAPRRQRHVRDGSAGRERRGPPGPVARPSRA